MLKSRSSTSRRAGTTLMEVLVGLGIMAIGVIGVMSLYPFAALTIGQALRDDRAVTCAITADGEIRDIHYHNVVEPDQNGLPVAEPYWAALDNPGVHPTFGPLPPPAGNSPSYPVALDPMGYAARAGRPDQFWIGDSLTPPNALTGVPRRPLKITDPAYVASLPLAQQYDPRELAKRFCSQIDGLTYNEDGQASSNPADMRELRYNWLWVLQRPSNSAKYTVRLQELVFNNRAHLYAPPKFEALPGVAAPNALFNAVFVPGETSITNVPSTAELRKGSWVMDATIANTPDGDGVTRWKRHAEFYRVLAVTEVPAAGGGTTLSLDVHKPIVRADGMTNTVAAPTAANYVGTLVALPGVIDVFERTVLSASPGP